MELLVIRHATAEDESPGVDDAHRELTKDGKKEMKRAAAGLKTLVDAIDVLAASPLVRAQQTAEIVAKAYGHLSVETVEELTPASDPRALADWLSRSASTNIVAVVGHEPHLGKLVTWLMTGAGNSRVEMKKAGAALLEFSSGVGEGGGTLQWLLTGSQLRHLGK
jgi:phosphohistidine phosphatase